jgi:hypothetical protein
VIADVSVRYVRLSSAARARDQPYQDLGADWLSHRNDQARTRKLVAQLERLGHTVIIDPAA